MAAQIANGTVQLVSFFAVLRTITINNNYDRGQLSYPTDTVTNLSPHIEYEQRQNDTVSSHSNS